MNVKITKFLFANKIHLNYEHNWSLSNLYLPLIGMESYCLYQLLVNLAPSVDEIEHNHVYNLLNISPDKLQELTLKLEAVALIQTLLDKNTNQTYTKLKKPCLVAQFLTDVQKREYLKRTVGEVTFKCIYKSAKNQFGTSIEENRELIDISAEFGEVFESLINNVHDFNDNIIIDSTTKSNSQNFYKFRQDLEEALKQQHLTVKHLDVIIDDVWKINQMYNPTLNQLIKSYTISLGQDGKVNLRVLAETVKRIVVANLDINKQSTKIPDDKLINKNNQKNNIVNKPSSKPTSLEQMLDMMSPTEFLKFQAKSKNIADADKRLVMKLENNFGFSQGVINALLFYVLKKTDNKLPSAFVDKIAGEWQRKQIKNTAQALNLIKPQKQSSVKAYGYKQDEAIPDWMKEKSQNDAALTKQKNNEFSKQTLTEEEKEKEIEKGKRELEEVMKGIGW